MYFTRNPEYVITMETDDESRMALDTSKDEEFDIVVCDKTPQQTRPNIFDKFLTPSMREMRDRKRMEEGWEPHELVSKDTAYRQSVYSDVAEKKKLKQRALPFLQKSIDDAFGESEISDFSKYTSDELADGFIRACIIDYLYGAGSIGNAWKAVFVVKEINEKELASKNNIRIKDGEIE
jgi:hypothetical protein